MSAVQRFHISGCSNANRVNASTSTHSKYNTSFQSSLDRLAITRLHVT